MSHIMRAGKSVFWREPHFGQTDGAHFVYRKPQATSDAMHPTTQQTKRVKIHFFDLQLQLPYLNGKTPLYSITTH